MIRTSTRKARVSRQLFAFWLFCLASVASAMPLALRALGGGQVIEAEVRASESGPSSLLLTLRLPGFKGAVLEDGSYSEGLALVAEADRPYIDNEGRSGSELVLEFRSAKGGREHVGQLRLRGAGKTVELAAFDLDFPEFGASALLPVPWAWQLPEQVWRFQSFALTLRPLDGSTPDPTAWPSFDLPSGLLVEEGSTPFSWVATALDAGTIRLPPVRIVGNPEGKAVGSPLIVEELPFQVEASRAIGDFSLSLEAPKEASAGSTLSLRLVLSGQGNIPALRLPQALLALDGHEIPADSFSERRVDAVAKTPDGYKGTAIMEVDIVPDKEGSLHVSVQPWTYLTLKGSFFTIPAQRRSIQIHRGNQLPATSGLAEASRILAARGGKAAAAALAELKAGNTAAALSGYFHAARVDFRYRDSARSLARTLGAAPPDLGFPLGPFVLFVASALLIGLIVGLRLVARNNFRAHKGGKDRGAFGLGYILASFFALALLVAGLMALTDASRPRWLAFSTSMATRPSEYSERHLSLPLGSTGRKIGDSGDWICLEFADGSAGWLPRSSVYSY